jgi:hypothetical protein
VRTQKPLICEIVRSIGEIRVVSEPRICEIVRSIGEICGLT